jgi:uncharacterized protein
MSGLQLITLTAAAGAAGAVNAVAGGGTLITFPVLLLVGTTPIVANATSTLALVFGNFGSVYGYRRKIATVNPWLKRFVPVSLVGGLLGGILLTSTGEQVFAELVPYLILFATVLFMAQGAFRRLARAEAQEATPATEGKRVWLALLFQFLVALYGGYFGAGIGILMLASLGFLGLTDIHEMNGLKTVLGLLINLVAAAYFVFKGIIDWPKMAVMTGGALAGYFLGAHYSQRIPQRQVRQIITGIGFTISAAMFYKRFR